MGFCRHSNKHSWVPQEAGSFLTSRVTTNFPRYTQHHAVSQSVDITSDASCKLQENTVGKNSKNFLYWSEISFISGTCPKSQSNCYVIYKSTNQSPFCGANSHSASQETPHLYRTQKFITSGSSTVLSNASQPRRLWLKLMVPISTYQSYYVQYTDIQNFNPLSNPYPPSAREISASVHMKW